MFVYLSKLLPLFIYPLGLGCILLIIVLASEKHKKAAPRAAHFSAGHSLGGQQPLGQLWIGPIARMAQPAP